jgi:4-hydroxy-tetrahydrodipicolinate reductase
VAEPIRIAIAGVTGRLGRLIAGLARDAPDLVLVGGVGRTAYGPGEAVAWSVPRIETPASAGSLLAATDVLIDVSAPALLAAVLAAHGDALAGRALVTGTTGLGPAERAALDAQAGRSAVLAAANFSLGVALLEALVERAAAVLDPAGWDVEIVETHHRGKADAPSGTALALGDAAGRGRGVRLDAVRTDGRSGATGPRPAGEIGLHAVRGGGVIGEHRVLFLAPRERLELAHAATDRALFADGALAAARWIAGRPAGRYGMRSLFEAAPPDPGPGRAVR